MRIEDQEREKELTRREDYSWLATWTGYSQTYWIERVEDTIREHSRVDRTVADRDGGEYSTTDTLTVMQDLFREVHDALEANGRGGDMVMGMFSTLAMVFVNWYAAVAKAKAHDARRPQRDRLILLGLLQDYVRELLNIGMGEAAARAVFHDHDWFSPYDDDIG